MGRDNEGFIDPMFEKPSPEEAERVKSLIGDKGLGEIRPVVLEDIDDLAAQKAIGPIIKDELELFIMCDCHGEAMHVYYDKELNYFEFAYWQDGYRGKPSWVQQLRQIWNIITKGRPYTDQLCLDAVKARKLMDFIKNHIDFN